VTDRDALRAVPGPNPAQKNCSSGAAIRRYR
jgi:hypothetical protein